MSNLQLQRDLSMARATIRQQQRRISDLQATIRRLRTLQASKQDTDSENAEISSVQPV